MKKFKKIASLALVIIMMLALVIPAFADETDPVNEDTTVVTTAPNAGVGVGDDAVKGSITISDAIVGENISIYQVLILESYNKDAGAYSYVADDAWVDFFKTNTAATAIFKINDQNYVTKYVDSPSATQLQTFASAALEYANTLVPVDPANPDGAKKPRIAATDTAEEVASATVVFDDLDLGYYVLSSTLGTVCSITTTAPNATVKVKNPTSTLKKTVSDNNLNIGDTVTFTLSIEVKPDTDAQSSFTNAFINNFYIHDKMDSTLDFKSNTLKVVIKNKNNITITDATKYTIKTGEEVEDGCIFEIDFEDNYLKSGDVITVTYDATLNSTAVIGPEGNTNEARITYGNKQSVKKEVDVYTTAVNIYKHEANNENKPLPGAEFILRRTVGEGETEHLEYYKATVDAETGKVTKVDWIHEKEDATVVTTGADGKAAFVGIEAGDYELEEIKAPDGYNKLPEPVGVSVSDSFDDNGRPEEGSFVPVTEPIANSKGALLPATGGLGTTMFITFGAIVALGTGVILVTRRRVSMMNNED